ncbi:Pod-EPPT protein [Elysia marginata]|uniref:Pod-EPPT protein n=1 Tax=Elysia marginata TaxID=1093978 RepID=A0AAV4FNU4_9GAST|nr:Pod-EPPT protein [Elysia marginata]
MAVASLSSRKQQDIGVIMKKRSYCSNIRMVGSQQAVLFIAALALSSYGDAVCPPEFSISATRKATFVGCYRSNHVKTVLPQNTLMNYRSTIDWALWARNVFATDLIEKCGEKAVEKGVNYFGIEFYGECYFGNNPDFGAQHLSCNDHCPYGVGASSEMALYKVELGQPVSIFFNIISHF